MTRLPPPPPMVACCSNVAVLAPKFRDAVARILARLDELGMKGRVAETLRTNARQQYLYGFGRDYDDDRGVVTQSDNAFTTWHGYGLAVDIVSATLEWAAPTTFWEALARLALTEGLTSGADWNRNGLHDEKFCDRPHVQWYCPGMHVAPSDHARALVEQAGIEAVWKEVGAS
jgi:hypothetical protein